MPDVVDAKALFENLENERMRAQFAAGVKRVTNITTHCDKILIRGRKMYVYLLHLTTILFPLDSIVLYLMQIPEQRNSTIDSHRHNGVAEAPE
jgi:hypothetical protein